jgi:hypothetical protein
MGEYGVFTRGLTMRAADKVLRAAFHTFAYAGGYYDYHLPDMHAVAEVAAPYYDNNLRGGEGHMEVGKLILNVVKNKATMTLSVKPFGCMPSSSVSDGVQSLITEKYPGTIFCAVETSGDGAVNFQSRVQMYLFKAKQVAQAEMDDALAKTNLTIDQVRDFLAKNPRYANALHRAPHGGGSTPVDLVYEVADLIHKNAAERALEGAQGAAKRTLEWARGALLGAPTSAKKTLEAGQQLARELAEIAKDHGPALAQKAVQKSVEQARTRLEKSKLAQVLPFVARTSEGELAAE